MILNAISPDAYRSQAHFELESDLIFKKCWVFVGTRKELSDHHLGCNLSGVGIIVQLSRDGSPRAYLNACSHRQAQLCKLGAHSGPIRCPYHGWVYDREGVPVGIPQRHAFPHVVAEPEKYRLTAIRCEAAGEFVFICLDRGGPSLPEYLGDQYQFLLGASKGLDQVEDEFRGEVSANWKVAIENSLEGYHVPLVHSSSLMQAEGMGKEESAPVFYLNDRLHSHLEHAADKNWLAKFNRLLPKIGAWSEKNEHYTHHFIFPNLTVTSFMGYSFHVQSFEPTQVSMTTVHSRTLGVVFEAQSVVGKKMMEKIYADGHAFTRRVFDEDASICQRVQAGLQYADRSATFGIGIEDRVRNFHQAYSWILSMSERPAQSN